MIDATAIRLRYEALEPVLDERGRRRFAAAEARAAGRGGIAAVSRITGIARSTIGRGLVELRGETAAAVPAGRVRRAGGGRKPLVATDATLLGDPMAPLLWTAKSLRKLAAELKGRGHRIGHSPRWPRCCAAWATAFRETARPWRGPAILIATPS